MALTACNSKEEELKATIEKQQKFIDQKEYKFMEQVDNLQGKIRRLQNSKDENYLGVVTAADSLHATIVFYEISEDYVEGQGSPKIAFTITIKDKWDKRRYFIGDKVRLIPGGDEE